MTAPMAAGPGVNGVELGVVLFFFLLVTVGGFLAARWRRPASMSSLDEWGLGGRGFGSVITWFLLGGDLYTAYTFIAVPAAMYATGAVTGFFAVPYTIVVYPLIFIFMPRMWSVAHRHGYVTPADFVRGRYDSRVLATGGRGHRHRRDDALHRPAAGRHPGGTRHDGAGRGEQRLPARPAAVHRLRGAGGLHLLLRPAGAGADRLRQGHADLHRDHRRDRLRRREDRLRRHVRRGGDEDELGVAGNAQSRRGVHPGSEQLLGLRHARPRLGDGAVHVSALDDGRAVGQEPQRDPAQRRRSCRRTR